MNDLSSRPSVGRWWRAAPMADRTSRICLAVAMVLAVAGLVHLGVFALDDRPWNGPISWRKPFTFGVSFGLTLATVTWVTIYLRLAPKRRSLLLGVLAVISVVEVSGITVQAWRGVPSHLNTSTSINAAIAYTLAAGGAGLVLVLGTLAVIAWRDRIDGSADIVLAVRVGFALLVVGLLSGVAMIARGTVVRRTDGATAAYTATGFLKDVHGVTLHGVLVLPLLAVALSRTPLRLTTRHRIVASASAAYVTAAVALLVLNLA